MGFGPWAFKEAQFFVLQDSSASVNVTVSTTTVEVTCPPIPKVTVTLPYNRLVDNVTITAWVVRTSLTPFHLVKIEVLAPPHTSRLLICSPLCLC